MPATEQHTLLPLSSMHVALPVEGMAVVTASFSHMSVRYKQRIDTHMSVRYKQRIDTLHGN